MDAIERALAIAARNKLTKQDKKKVARLSSECFISACVPACLRAQARRPES